MTSELAKLLKNAGFPQSKTGAASHSPTLSELVAACKGNFSSLRRAPDGKWIAAGRIAAKDGQIPYFESAFYDEPDEAVAELFLAIKAHERDASKAK